MVLIVLMQERGSLGLVHWDVFFCCCLDEASCTGCYWWLVDAGSCIQVVSFV